MSSTPLSESSVHLGLEQQLPVIDSSTTSRVLVSNDLLRVVQFTFDAGQQLTEHSSPRAVACILNSGRMKFSIEGAEHQFGPGDVIYLAPDAPHALVAETACRLTLVMVDKDYRG